jgi:hypothetical protein
MPENAYPFVIAVNKDVDEFHESPKLGKIMKIEINYKRGVLCPA